MSVFATQLKRDCLFFWVIATSSLCIGLLLNQFRDDPLDLIYRTKEQRIMKVVERKNRESVATDPNVTAAPEFVSLAELKQMMKDRACLVLDARPEVFHRLGHIPGALSLPRDDFKKGYDLIQSTLEGDKNQRIIVYCSAASCGDSNLVRKALMALGYNRVSILKGGWAIWKGEGGESVEDGS